MPCEFRGNTIICSRGSRAPKCEWCHRTSTKLCDYPVAGEKTGTTCDAPMCDRHATNVGPNRDYCPPHQRIEEATWQAKC